MQAQNALSPSVLRPQLQDLQHQLHPAIINMPQQHPSFIGPGLQEASGCTNRGRQVPTQVLVTCKLGRSPRPALRTPAAASAAPPAPCSPWRPIGSSSYGALDSGRRGQQCPPCPRPRCYPHPCPPLTRCQQGRPPPCHSARPRLCCLPGQIPGGPAAISTLISTAM